MKTSGKLITAACGIGTALCIEFNDLSEVDGLIHLLANFKTYCLNSPIYYTNRTDIIGGSE